MLAIRNFAASANRLTDGSVELLLEGYGCRWLRVLGPSDKRLS